MAQCVDQPGESVCAGGEVRIGDAGLHFGEVLSGAERPARAGDRDDGNLRIVGGGVQRFGGGVVQRLVEGVEGLRPVEGEGADPVVVGDEQRHLHQPKSQGR
jgi:hypothetical protein